MPLPCVVRTLSGVRQLINLYLLDAPSTLAECGPMEFSVAGQYVKLNGKCGLELGSLSAALDRPVWYSYGRQTVSRCAECLEWCALYQGLFDVERWWG